MKPTKDNLKDELKYRVELLNEFIKQFEGDPLVKPFENEKSILLEILNLIEIFDNRIGYSKHIESNYTPIKDYITKEPLKLGDKVKSGEPFSNANGILIFDEYDNRYKIKTMGGGNIKPSSFIKIKENYDFTIDNSRVECRPNPYKKRW